MPKAIMDDGVRLHYQIDDFTPPWETDQEVVFMHHGFARNMKWWTLIVPMIARKYRVLRIDARGCGESKIKKSQMTWSPDVPLNDVINLLDRLNIKKIHWVGESSGGLLGIQFALTHPERVRSLTLSNTPLVFPESMVKVYPQGFSDAATAIERLGLKKWRIQTMGFRVGATEKKLPMVEWFQTEQMKTPTLVAASFMRIFQSMDFSNRLGEVPVPILFLLGNKAPTIPPSHRSFLTQNIPNLKVVQFNDVSSDIQLVKPDRCAEEILGFLGNVKNKR